MSTPSVPPSRSDDLGPQQLTDRIMARVQDARLVIEAQAHSLSSRERRRRAGDRARSSASTKTPAELREARALRRVFSDLGESYRSYRRRTGEPVAAGVREAATHFRKHPGLDSLVSVAVSLEQLDPMIW